MGSLRSRDAEKWDLVERGPNYLLPLGLVYLVYRKRHEHTAEAAAPSPAQPELRRTRPVAPTA